MSEKDSSLAPSRARWTKFAGLAILALSLIWVLSLTPRAINNLRGVCNATGTVLSPAELKRRVIENIESEIASGEIEIGWYVREMNDPSYFRHSITDVHLYPNIPEYAAYSNGEYSSYKHGRLYEPVPWWNKISGYAHYLVFTDANFVAVNRRGEELPKRVDLRDWADSCGSLVVTPEDHVLG